MSQAVGVFRDAGLKAHLRNLEVMLQSNKSKTLKIFGPEKKKKNVGSLTAVKNK